MTGPTIALATAYRRSIVGTVSDRLDTEDLEMATILIRLLAEQGYEIRAKEQER